MKTTIIYEVKIETMCSHDWEGVFLMSPTIHDIESAIIIDIKRLSKHGEEDHDEASFYIERLQQIQRIVAEVDERELEQHGKRSVTVAGVTIGYISTSNTKAYDAGEPAEVSDFPARYCRDRDASP